MHAKTKSIEQIIDFCCIGNVSMRLLQQKIALFVLRYVVRLYQGARMSLIHLIIGWHDIIEVLFFATLVYYFSRWLINDKQKNLLFSFYGYCIAFVAAFYGNFPTIATLLFVSAPIMLVIFIVLHQEILQRNFVSLKNIRPARTHDTEDWVEALIRCCLMAMNNNKEFLCVIEQKDSLLDLMDSAFFIDAPLNSGLLGLLLENNSIESDKLLWITHTGALRAINAQWNLEKQNLSHVEEDTTSWKHAATFISSKTDAIIFKASPAHRLFDVVVQEQQFERLNATMIIKLIKKYQGSVKKQSQGGIDVPHHQKGINQQHRA